MFAAKNKRIYSAFSITYCEGITDRKRKGSGQLQGREFSHVTEVNVP